LVKNQKLLILALILIAIVVSFQSYFLGTKIIEGTDFTHYNNYLIFKQSYFNLVNNNDLYDYNYPHHFDLLVSGLGLKPCTFSAVL